MKTILVLTDFSINADDAAHYALQLAQQIKANLLLCNIYALPEDEQAVQPGKWPLPQHQANSINDLDALMGCLKTQIDKNENKEDYRPEIDQYSKEGTVEDCINEIAKTHHIIMAVISMHSANWLSTLSKGNHEWDIIEEANFPVLIVPYQVRFKAYKTIAFATAMNYTDINVLQSLSGLAKYSDAEILLTHVVDQNVDSGQEEDQMDQFFNQIPSKINYPKIIYRAIKGDNISNSLKLLTEHIEVDLLVLVHRKRGFLKKIFGTNITQRMANRPVKPLLIFPGSKDLEVLPIF